MKQLKTPTTYKQAVKIKYPQISTSNSPFDRELTSVILELAFLNEEEGKKLWKMYQQGTIPADYWDL